MHFSVKELNLKVFPEIGDEATMNVAEACTLLSLVCTAILISVIETCGFIATCVRSHPCHVNHSCLDGSPSREHCEQKSICNHKSECEKGTLCGKCTHNPTACHCTHDTACHPGNQETCNKTNPWCNGDGNSCPDGDVNTKGCGCTNAHCSNQCTNNDTKYDQPASPVDKEPMPTTETLLAQLKEDLLRRLAA